MPASRSAVIRSEADRIEIRRRIDEATREREIPVRKRMLERDIDSGVFQTNGHALGESPSVEPDPVPGSSVPVPSRLVPCRRTGCGEPATGTHDRGTFANLCAEHLEDARELASQKARDHHARRRAATRKLYANVEVEIPDQAVPVESETTLAAREFAAAVSYLEDARRELGRAMVRYREAAAALLDSPVFQDIPRDVLLEALGDVVYPAD